MAVSVVSASEGVSNRDVGIRVASAALVYIGGLVPSAFSWCAAAGPGGGPDLRRPVVCRPGPGQTIDPATFLNDYRWLGMSEDPFRIVPESDPGSVVRGVTDFGGEEKFLRHPFTTRFLARHGLGSRTVVYLRDRGPVIAEIALDRARDTPAPDRHELVLLLKLAPLLTQAIAAGSFPDADPAPGPLKLAPVPVPGLTPREEQVARMVARGLSNHEIAQELAISPGTVKIHVGRIYRKSGTGTRARLVLLLNARPAVGTPE